MRLYAAGPMRGLPWFGFPVFDEVTRCLRGMGHEVVSPAEMDLAEGLDISLYEDPETPLPPEFDITERLVADIEEISRCDGIVMLPGWPHSKGASAELAFAKALDLTVFYAQQDDDGWFFPGLSDTRQAPPSEGTPHLRVVPDTFNGNVQSYEAFQEQVHRQVTNEQSEVDRAKALHPSAGFFDRDPDEIREEAKRKTLEGLLARDGEVRVTDPVTGGSKGQKPAQFNLIPAGPLTELAEHYAKGAEKYSPGNWRRGYAWSLNFDAAMRHLWEFWNGEGLDPETQSKHVIAAAWHCFTLAQFMDTHPEKDDRPGTA